MKITAVRIKLTTSPDGKLKAWASVSFDDEFIVHNLKIIVGKEGVFVAMPNRKTRDGEYKDVAHPLSKGFRQVLNDSVLEAYRNETESSVAVVEADAENRERDRIGADVESNSLEDASAPISFAEDIGNEPSVQSTLPKNQGTPL